MTTPSISQRLLMSLAVALLCAGCASQMNPNVTDAEVAYRSAESDPVVASKGQVALYDAKKDLDEAKKAWNNGDDKEVVDHWAYLAKRKVDTARATAERANAQARVQTLGSQRDAAVLDSRTREADAERDRAESERDRAVMAETTSDALRRELSDLEAKDTDRGLVITFPNDVLFDTDRSDLKPGAMTELQRLASVLSHEPDRRVRVEGHADTTGSQSHNLALSKQRAEAVADALIQDGVAPSRVTSEGFGDEEPIATNATPEGRQQNRRVEVVVMQPGR